MKKTRRRGKKDSSGIKSLIASLSIAATIALWSIFASQDRITPQVQAQGQAAEGQSSSLLVEPLPTLVTIQFPDGEVVTVEEAQQDLRSVSAPAVSRPAPGNPVVVNSQPRVRQSNSNTTVTSTRSSG